MIVREYNSTRYREVNIDEQVEKSHGSSQMLQEVKYYSVARRKGFKSRGL